MDRSAYLQALGLDSEAVEGMLKTIEPVLIDLCGESFNDLIVTDYFKDDGTRVYESLNLFSGSYVVELRNFLDATQLDWDIACLSGMFYARVRSQHFDLKNATPASRLIVELALQYPCTIDLKASGDNCTYLWELYRRLLRTHLNRTHFDPQHP